MPGDRRTRASLAIENLWSDILVVAVRGGFFECDPSWELQPRVRPDYQLWMCTGGTAMLNLNGQELDLVSGTSIIVPPHVSHSARHEPDDPLCCYVLHFGLRLTSSVAPLSVDILPRALRPSPTSQAALISAAAEVCEESDSCRPGNVLLANAAMARVLGLLWREAADQGATSSLATGQDSPMGPVAEVLTYIAAHYAESLTLSDLANIAGFSPSHFSVVFRKAIGLSPMRYLHHYRLQRAKALLVSSDLSVAEIASSVGFADPFYFSRVLKQAEGLAPTQYRLSKRSASLP